MALLSFLTALLVLGTEGWLLMGLLVPAHDRALRLALALPSAAVTNVLLFFLFTVLRVPLAPLPLLLGHAAIIVTVWSCLARALRQRSGQAPHSAAGACGWSASTGSGLLPILLRSVCMLLLTNIFIYSAAHALLLPTFSIDSLTNWTMRAQISFVDRSLAFDRTEDRGMAKPQYPFLTHALQIAGNQGQEAWNDRAANATTWLLSLSVFSALFLMLRRLRGTDTALLALTLILGIPLLSVHLAQGYGDIHLVEYLLLALIALALLWETGKQEWGLLSAAMILGALWTKSEGLFFGFLPWALILSGTTLLRKEPLRPVLLTVAMTLALFLPFLGLLASQGLPFTPHGTDARFAWHPEGLSALLPSLFGGGSFGIVWYVLSIATVLLLGALQRNHPTVEPRQAPLLLWGWLIALQNFVIYLFTSNVAFLQSGESFFRQMLPAAALLILSCALIIRPNPNPNPHPSS